MPPLFTTDPHPFLNMCFHVVQVLSAAAVYIQAICRSRLARTRAAALYTIRAQRLYVPYPYHNILNQSHSSTMHLSSTSPPPSPSSNLSIGPVCCRLDMSVSALPIQCAFRRYWAMKTLARLKADKLFKHVQTLHATRVIQRAWFAYKGAWHYLIRAGLEDSGSCFQWPNYPTRPTLGSGSPAAARLALSVGLTLLVSIVMQGRWRSSVRRVRWRRRSRHSG